jgi:hypothetical protein
VFANQLADPDADGTQPPHSSARPLPHCSSASHKLDNTIKAAALKAADQEEVRELLSQ